MGRSKVRLAIASAIAGCAVLTACASALPLPTAQGQAVSDASSESSAQEQAVSEASSKLAEQVPAKSQAVITGAFFDQSGVDARQPLTLDVQQGKFVSVAITDPAGKPVTGSAGPGETTWQVPAGALKAGTTYQVQAAAVDRAGREATAVSSFTTAAPTRSNNFEFSLREGATYGVGMPVSLRFEGTVKDRAAVERKLKVTTSVPVEGGWSWVGEKTVTYRPKEYWPAGTTVTVSAPLEGVETEPGMVVAADKSMSFKIGSSVISVVDAQTHQMTVTKDGEVINTIPITTGKPGSETRSGIKVIMSKDRRMTMDSATLGVGKGSPDYYRLDVEYAMRLTTSGEFVHSAPWSVGSQGKENVSHGCVGMSTANAEWFYNQSKIGDILQVTNTGRKQDAGNGITVWNVGWDAWQAGSALR